MKKKIIAILVVLIFVSIQLTSLSAAAPTYNAKASDPTVDAVINAAEYGPAYVMDASNSSNWTQATGTAPTINYYFAWSDKGFYVAVKSADLVVKDQVQVNLNPNNLVKSGGAGIFFTFEPNAKGEVKVLRHNYQPASVTTNKDGIPGGFDITTKVTAKADLTSGMTFEVFIPIAELQVKSTATQKAPNVLDASTFTLKANDSWGFGTYAILASKGTTLTAWTSLLGTNVPIAQITNKAFQVQNLGTITLLATGVEATAAPAATATATAAPTVAKTNAPAATTANKADGEAKSNTLLYVIAGVAGVVVIGGILYFVLRKKK